MAVHYDISSLDSNKTILETLHRIEKYLKDNPIYKVFAINAPYVAGEQYNLTDLIASDSTLAEGDVVFFTNNYYAFVSAVGSEVFSVANASYFKGETGAQGAQGEQGKAGEDGADTLWYKNNILISTAEQFTALLNEASHSFSTAYFNRTPKVGDNFMVFVYLSYAKETYWLQYQVSAVSGGSTTAVYQNSYAKLTGAKGEKGETGVPALVYDRKIDFVWNEQSQQLISVTLPIANFNRTPNLNEDFVAILHDTVSGVDYLAMGEIQTITSGGVTSIVAVDITRITGINGADGQNGTNGTDGEDALVCTELIVSQYSSMAPGAIVPANNSSLNRTPVVNETLSGVLIKTSNNHTYIATGKIQAVFSNSVNIKIVSCNDITGAQGAGSQLYEHKILITHSGNSTHALFSFISQDNTPINTLSSLATLLRRTLDETQINGIIVDASSNYNQAMIIFYSETDSAVAYRYERSGSITGYALLSTAYIYTDTVRAI